MTELRRRETRSPVGSVLRAHWACVGSNALFRRGRAGLRRARPLVRGGVTHRYAAALAAIWFETVPPCLREGPEAKAPAQRGLSRRPDCARAGLRRARAHDSDLAPKRSQLKGTER